MVLTPTRELALQLHDQFSAFGAYMYLKVACIVGGLDITRQACALLHERPHVVISTPGRLLTLLEQPELLGLFKHLAFIVKDESDFLDESQGPELQEILSQINVATLLEFSATLDSDYTLGARSDITEKYLLIPAAVKDYYLYLLLTRFSSENSIVFTESCAEAQFLAEVLSELALPVLPLHSLLSQYERQHNLEVFRASRSAVLVATDVASRGLDIPSVKLVINHNVPRSSKLYLHRVGRTSRAGRTGIALTLVTQYECKLVLHIEHKLQVKLSELYNDNEQKTLEDEVRDVMGKLTSVKALVSHRMNRPLLKEHRRRSLLRSGLKKLKR